MFAVLACNRLLFFEGATATEAAITLHWTSKQENEWLREFPKKWKQHVSRLKTNKHFENTQATLHILLIFDNANNIFFSTNTEQFQFISKCVFY